MWILVGLVLSYLIGAIPFALLIARTQGVDIRAVGSGNVGATNVYRSVGKSWGVLTFIADVLKGVFTAAALPALLPEAGHVANIGLLFGCAAVVGHNWPVYLRFAGGKGVATSAGVLLGVAPGSMGIGVVAWLLILAISRYVSLASIGAALVILATGWWLYGADNPTLVIVLTVMALVVVGRHHSNIRRLLAGTEHTYRKEVEAKEDPS